MTEDKDTTTFRYHNENPRKIKAGDCVFRAIATATGKTWETVFTELAEYALKYKRSPSEKQLYTIYLADHGWELQRQPRKPNNKKYTGKEFCEKFQFDGSVLAHIGGNHIVCIKDGMVWDSWDSTDYCIGNYWTKTK